MSASVERFCPKCGARGTSAFCPSDGTEMKQLAPSFATPPSPPPFPYESLRAPEALAPPPPPFTSQPSAPTVSPRSMSKKARTAVILGIIVVVSFLAFGILSALVFQPNYQFQVVETTSMCSSGTATLNLYVSPLGVQPTRSALVTLHVWILGQDFGTTQVTWTPPYSNSETLNYYNVGGACATTSGTRLDINGNSNVVVQSFQFL